VTALSRLAVLALVPLAVGSPASTGLRGTVTKGPVTPVCQEGTPCDAPSKHTTLVFVRNSRSKSTVTDADGRYSILLAAGTYAIRIPSARFGFTPRTVTVRAGRMTARNISIDTGIR
jgi:hypothetical protein